MSEFLTMRQSISALRFMAWSDNEVTFCPPSQTSELNPKGQWVLWDNEGVLTLAPFYCSDVKVRECDITYRMFRQSEVVVINSPDDIPAEVADSEFHVEIAPPMGEFLHEEKCAIFAGGPCTCKEDEDVEEDEDEVEIK